MQIRICSTCCGRGHPKGCPLSFLASEILIYAIFLPLYVHFNTSDLFLLGPPSATCQSQVDNPTQLTRQKCRASFAEPRKSAGFGPDGFGLLSNTNPCSWPLASAFTTPAIKLPSFRRAERLSLLLRPSALCPVSPSAVG